MRGEGVGRIGLGVDSGIGVRVDVDGWMNNGLQKATLCIRLESTARSLLRLV